MEPSYSADVVRPLRSLYADDEVIADIIPAFVQNMPRYVSDIRASVARGDWLAGARICHDLKGTAGGYGYPQIGHVAQLIEEELKGGCLLPVIERHLADATKLCHLAELGLGVGH